MIGTRFKSALGRELVFGASTWFRTALGRRRTDGWYQLSKADRQRANDFDHRLFDG